MNFTQEQILELMLNMVDSTSKCNYLVYKFIKYIFSFLCHHKVPPDNNASERAIRNVKVK